MNDPLITDETLFYTPVDATLPVTSQQLGTATQHDPQLAQVHHWIRTGWPATVPDECKPYANRRHELSTDGNCLLWGARVVVPATLQEQILLMLHEQHPGICRMKAIARSHVWWPNLDHQIEELVRLCHSCQLAQNEVAKSPLSPWEFSARPWQCLHIDFAEFDQQHYIVVVDAIPNGQRSCPCTPRR